MTIKKYLAGWLVPVAIAGVFFAGKTLTETDADKKAHQDAFAAKMNKFTTNVLDKSGVLREADALASLTGSFFKSCKANVVPGDPSTTLGDDDKKNYCGCAALGMMKLYYGNLPDDDLIQHANLPPPYDLGPANVRRQVFEACNASLDAYK